MSRYIGHTEEHAFAYGFDACGIPGYFVTADKDFDTRKFMADEGCHVSLGRILEMLTEMNDRGANVPEDHLTATRRSGRHAAREDGDGQDRPVCRRDLIGGSHHSANRRTGTRQRDRQYGADAPEREPEEG